MKSVLTSVSQCFYNVSNMAFIVQSALVEKEVAHFLHEENATNEEEAQSALKRLQFGLELCIANDRVHATDAIITRLFAILEMSVRGERVEASECGDVAGALMRS
jgi:hypothetical protein